MRTRTFRTAFAFVTAALMLTGCASTAAAPATHTSDPAAATSDPVTAPSAGERVTDQALAEAAVAAGLGYYDWQDGTFTIVDPHAPYPDDIVTDMHTVLGVWDKAEATSDPAGTGPRRKALAVIGARAAHTGRVSVLIMVVGQYDTDGNLVDSGWNDSAGTPPGADQPATEFGAPVNADGNTVDWFPSAEAAVAHAQTAIAQQPDPSLYEILDLSR